MKWISVEEQPIPQDKWVLAYCKIEKDIGTEEFVFEDDSPNIYVVKQNSWTFDVCKNSCGCCHRDILPIAWIPLPKEPDDLERPEFGHYSDRK